MEGLWELELARACTSATKFFKPIEELIAEATFAQVCVCVCERARISLAGPHLRLQYDSRKLGKLDVDSFARFVRNDDHLLGLVRAMPSLIG